MRIISLHIIIFRRFVFFFVFVGGFLALGRFFDSFAANEQPVSINSERSTCHERAVVLSGHGGKRVQLIGENDGDVVYLVVQLFA